MKVEKMISYEEAEGKKETLGGMGGFFSDGMRWKDYLEAISPDAHVYAEAFRTYVVENEIKRGGNWHQSSNDNGVPLFDDGSIGSFSYRAWGDIMAAIWSEADGTDYNYMTFYMDLYL